jgi:dipeptidyl aminopeptidase/acylaminoacyl peptidase
LFRSSSWSYRWNPQLFAAAGYAVVMINFHGSDTYGQNFTDSIRGDYGGKPFRDLKNGLNYMLKQYSYLDGDRVAALGASYGGFMCNWIAGHNIRDDGSNKPIFSVIVTHDGMFDIRGFYYMTEELWFIEHDMEGIPWINPQNYEQWNPANYIQNWNTPHMIIHGGHDFRIDQSQGISAFTALQRRGIPSKFLYFPKENHWVLNTQNSIYWYESVLEFIQPYTKN